MWSRTLLRYLCVLARSWARLLLFPGPQDDSSGLRLLNPGEGATLVNNAWEQRDEVRSKPDCSHLVQPDLRVVGFPLSLRKFL